MLFVGKQGAFFMNKIRQNKAKQGRTRQKTDSDLVNSSNFASDFE